MIHHSAYYDVRFASAACTGQFYVAVGILREKFGHIGFDLLSQFDLRDIEPVRNSIVEGKRYSQENRSQRHDRPVRFDN